MAANLPAPLTGFPPAWPFTPADFEREDSASDAAHYVMPRFVQHVDAAAAYALRLVYEEELCAISGEVGGRPLNVLDVGASWVSHLEHGREFGRVCGVGLNSDELERNGVLTEYFVQDLNAHPNLPTLLSNSYDVAVCSFSIQYFKRPRELLAELLRVLRPGGVVLVAFSDRMFPTKAVAAWRDAGRGCGGHAASAERARIVATYLHFAGRGGGDGGGGTGPHGAFRVPHWLDASPDPGRTDPLHVVLARKEGPLV